MKQDAIKLHSTDFYFLAMESCVPAQGLLVTVRFETGHLVEDVRSAVRKTFSIYPKLRTLIVPTLFSYRFRILSDDDPRLAHLFNEAFRVNHGIAVDSDEFLQCRRALLNEPFALEYGLPIKIVYYPDDPQPVLHLCIHHMICDGMGYRHLVNSLIECLNGNSPPLCPQDNPSLRPVLLEKGFFRIAQQLFRSYHINKRQSQDTKNRKMINLSPKPANYFGPGDEHHHRLSRPLSEIKQRSDLLGCSFTAFMLTALAITFDRIAPDDAGDQIGMALPIDLRPFYPEDSRPIFGNYVYTPIIRVDRNHDGGPQEIAQDIKDQIRLHREHIRQKNILLPFLINKIFTLAGRKHYAHTIRILKTKGLISKTCLASSLGSMDYLNQAGTKARVCEVTPTTLYQGLLITMSTIGENVYLAFVFQEAEFNLDDIRSITDLLEDTVDYLLTAAPQDRITSGDTIY